MPAGTSPNRNSKSPLMNDSMLREPNNRTPILILWAVLICCVVIGSLAPAASPLMVAVGRLHIWDKLQHFGAYLALSFLPVIGFRDRRRGIIAGLSMFVLGTLLDVSAGLKEQRFRRF